MRLSKLVIIALASCLASCATVEVADGIQCAPERDDVMVRLVDTLSRENVSPIEQVPADLSLQYRCEPAGSSECVWRIDEGGRGLQVDASRKVSPQLKHARSG